MEITKGTWDYELTEIDSGDPRRPLPGPLVVYATWANDESVDVCTLSKTPEMQANARLIASAPAMYEALQDLVVAAGRLTTITSDKPNGFNKALQDARAALKAATGE